MWNSGCVILELELTVVDTNYRHSKQTWRTANMSSIIFVPVDKTLQFIS
jgi:hypothetical protein